MVGIQVWILRFKATQLFKLLNANNLQKRFASAMDVKVAKAPLALKQCTINVQAGSTIYWQQR
jgi:hypothetical protein